MKSRMGRKLKLKGGGIINKLIDLLPFEAHIPGYRYCGPGTKLEERLKRGDPGINPLDEACKKHDIVYSKTSDTAVRNKADLVLADEAWERVKSKDSSLPERIAAYGVTNAMKLKAKIGAGCGKRKKSGKAFRKKIGGGITKKKKKSQKRGTRVIPIPSGGKVNSILSTVGIPAKKVATTVKRIKSYVGKANKPVKLGKGLYLRPYKSGYGLLLKKPHNLN